MKADLPVNEALRQKALQDLAILDTPREQNFDDLAQIAMHLCDVPIAVITLIDRDRQWFKSCLGLDGEETPRDVAFCAHAILDPSDVLLVEDATKDPRFFDNPLVTGEPFIRFYAGAPLVTEDGFPLGTLCVVDYKARALGEAQIKSLKALARQTMQLISLNSARVAMQQHAQRVQLTADSVPVLIGEINSERRYTFANQKYADWLEQRNIILGKTPMDIYPAREHATISAAIDESFTGKIVKREILLPSGRLLDISYLPQYKDKHIVGLFEVASDVTERNMHMQTLQKERSRLESIIEGTNIGTWEWDLPTGKVMVNERWVSMLGYELSDLAPVTIDTWRGLLHPDDVQHTQELLEKHFSGELPFYDCEFRLRRKDGDWQWVHAHGKIVVRDAASKPLVMSGMHTDMQDIKNTYNRLKEREDLLRSMLSNFPGAAYRCLNNPNWTMQYLSDAVQQLTGYSAEDFLGDRHVTFTEITHLEDVSRISKQVQIALEHKEPFNLEYRILRADGQWRHVEEFGRGVYDAQGNLQYIDGFIWDVQARHDSEYEKHVMTTKMSQLFEMAPIGILQVSEDGSLLDANPEFCKMLGYSQEELRAKTFMDLTPNEEKEKSARGAAWLKSRGRFGPMEKSYYTKSGELVPVEISSSLITSVEDSHQSWWTLVKDISEQKRMERMKNEFISTVSHELRTPLTSISGALGLVTGSMESVLPEKAYGILKIAYKNSQRLTVLINDLLDMEKLLAGKMYFELASQPLAPLIAQAMAENKSYADKYSVQYVLDDMAPGVHVEVDAFRLQQVLSNLLSNAAKYSPPNGQVDIILRPRDGWVRISVRDYGAGIPAEFRARIFQKFSQADSTDSRQKGGTGLGLAISKELVEHMGGRIGFDSEVDQGSCFYAEFKIVDGV